MMVYKLVYRTEEGNMPQRPAARQRYLPSLWLLNVHREFQSEQMDKKKKKKASRLERKK